MKLLVVDGNSIINRAYFGLRPLTAPDGTPTNAIYGFLTILSRLIDEYTPESVAVAFDMSAPTFRHDMYDGYKANRKPMPDDLAVQMPILKEILDAMNVVRIEKAGYEADDILGTVGDICENNGWECHIATGDRDSFQLISDKQSVVYISTRGGKTETILYDKKRFEDEYGFNPSLVVDLKSLMGDSSDNIPGIAGIGKKTATTLIEKYGSLENIYKNIDSLDVSSGVREKLKNGREDALLSYTLAEIDRKVPIDFALSDTSLGDKHTDELYAIFKRLGFKSFVEKWKLRPSNGQAEKSEVKTLSHILNPEPQIAFDMVKNADILAVDCPDGLNELHFCDGKSVISTSRLIFGEKYEELLKLIFSPDIKKIGSNIKDTMTELLVNGFSFGGFVFDVALAGYLLDSTESGYETERLAGQYLGHAEGQRAELLFKLFKPMSEKLKSMGMDKLMNEIEIPLCRVLAEMEKTGCLVDKKALNDFGSKLSVDIDKISHKIWEQAGHEFNINSPKQLGVVLFDELGLTAGKKTKTGRSTNAEVLEKLLEEHEIVADVLEYRMLTKLKSTYADGLLAVISPNGRIHTSFKMTVAATGRLSSTEPNLQNIPIRRELGSSIRKMFVAPEGSVLVDADYSQIELRILAHMSGDETMIEAFRDGVDIHSVTASRVFGVPLNEVTDRQRSNAKAVNFGIVYGISAFSLAQDIGVWPSEAKEYIDAYMEKYSGVADYMRSVIKNAKEDGYVKTLYGRRRPLPELSASNFNTRSFGERVARNMPIQGTAADIIKLAMVNVRNRIEKEGKSAKIILQVHDELLLECPLHEEAEVKKLLGEEMQNVIKLSVPLKVDVNSGSNWADAH